MVGETPLGHDRTAARHNARHTFCSEWHITQQHTGMDREVIHTLLGLLDQGIAENLPSQVFCFAIDLLERLVNRYRADGYWRITNNPFAGFMDMLASREIHDGVATPANRPGHFFNFLTN